MFTHGTAVSHFNIMHRNSHIWISCAFQYPISYLAVSVPIQYKSYLMRKKKIHIFVLYFYPALKISFEIFPVFFVLLLYTVLLPCNPFFYELFGKPFFPICLLYSLNVLLVGTNLLLSVTVQRPSSLPGDRNIKTFSNSLPARIEVTFS